MIPDIIIYSLRQDGKISTYVSGTVVIERQQSASGKNADP